MEQKVQNVFCRYENKYLISERKLELLQGSLSAFMKHDCYGAYTIDNIYYDTEDYALIRQSIEKPRYKEKLRLRSYGTPRAGDTVFAELKKKYDGVVYKRRIPLTVEDAYSYFETGRGMPDSQIMREINYFMEFYHPVAKVFLGYDRTALTGIENSELRLTFDSNIRWRTTALDLSQGSWGAPLLPPGQYLMEIKVPGTTPLWLSELLSRFQIFPVSFSKYGLCYQQYLIRDFLRKGVSVCA